jgi:hypothetical protein
MRGQRFNVPRVAPFAFIAITLSLPASFAFAGRAFHLSRIPDITASEDTPTAPVPFFISGLDADQPVGLLVSSSDPTLLPEANVRFGRSGDAHALVITPAPNQSGRGLLHLQATDGSLVATQSFSVTVNSINDAPTVSRVADQIILETATAATVSFSIGDVETPAASLIVTVASSNPALLPPQSMIVSGKGATRILTLQRAGGESGSATVTVTVSDGEASTSQQFQVTVGDVNRPPLVNAGPDQVITGTNAALLNGTATDDSAARLITSWSVVAPSAHVSFVDANALNTTAYFEHPGIYTLRLTASDGELSGSDDITVVVAEAQLAAIQGKGQNRR